jgi:hypothetical protein
MNKILEILLTKVQFIEQKWGQIGQELTKIIKNYQKLGKMMSFNHLFCY